MSVAFAVSTDSETCNGFSIADPIVRACSTSSAFDTATPQLVPDFARGAL